MKDENKTAKIIPFPGLASRLVEKGMDAIVNKDFREAAELLYQAVEIDENDSNAQFGLVVALVELGKYRDAKVYCHQLLQKGIGDYFKLMEMYVMILLELNEYEEMASTISMLLDENQVPFDKEEQFEKMLEFSHRMISEQPDNNFEEEIAEGHLDLLTKSNQEQLMIISKLKDDNARKYLGEINNYLQSEEGHPFLKTMLLLILKEQEVLEECIVNKFSKCKPVVPGLLEDVHSRPFYVETEKHLENVLEHQNPSMLQLVQQLLERSQFLLYPMEPEGDFESWAAAFHILAEQYQGITSSETEIMELYNGEIVKLKDALAVIQHIEEISSL
ncbi:tetratricopeptide repeat protein [Bacillus massiliigorillae]|uniref:tetratricopeptide repeat protein n=1 Tax=Bacillus massiliigorillae TaxID=1243664 RepID=UPI0003A3A31A|nr:tetratricopeptide repeat protein [Bacillus massiliigorillae]